MPQVALTPLGLPSLTTNHSSTQGSKQVMPPQVGYSITYFIHTVIHQVAQAGFPEEPPKNEQAMLIHAEFSDSAGPEKAPFSVFPLL